MLERNSNQWLAEFEQFLELQVQGNNELNQPLFDAIRYSLCSGGKRIRPMLLLAFYAMSGRDHHDAFPFAAAIEMIHASSLIHDDMPCMDDDALRRGRPTLHCAMGESVAMVAGDALLNLAYETMLGAARDAAALCAMRTIARAAGVFGVQGGQYLDTEVADKDEAVVLYTYEKKTAALIEAACLSGVQLADGTAEEERAASEYGKKLGIAFQIQDDILDVVGDVELTGKMTGNDAKCQKTTYLSIHGMEASQKEILRLLSDAKTALSVFGEKAEALLAFADSLIARKK